MPQKKHKPEEIVAKLRQVDVLLSQGRPVAEAIRTISVTPFTYYCQRRWKNQPRGGAIVYHLGAREVAPEWGARALARALPKLLACAKARWPVRANLRVSGFGGRFLRAALGEPVAVAILSTSTETGPPIGVEKAFWEPITPETGSLIARLSTS